MTLNIIAIACFGAFFNRFRGGGGTDLLHYFGINKSFPAQKIIYSILSGLILAWGNWLFLLPAIIGVRAAISFGWGSYISGLANNRLELRGDLEFVDNLVKDFKDATLANLVALSIRGAIWGLCIAASMLEIKYLILIPLFALFFPLSYYLTRKAKDSWGLGEILFGAICWSSYFYLN